MGNSTEDGRGQRLHTPMCAVYVDSSAAGRATNNVIRTLKPPTGESRRRHAFLEMALLQPGLSVWQAIGHAGRDANTRLPYLLGCNDLMQINRLKSFGLELAGLDIVGILVMYLHAPR